MTTIDLSKIKRILKEEVVSVNGRSETIHTALLDNFDEIEYRTYQDSAGRTILASVPKLLTKAVQPKITFSVEDILRMKLMSAGRMWKVLNMSMLHHDYQHVPGENKLKCDFDPNNTTAPGGLYFAVGVDILRWLQLGHYIWEVSLYPDSRVAEVTKDNNLKYKTDKYHLSNPRIITNRLLREIIGDQEVRDYFKTASSSDRNYLWAREDPSKDDIISLIKHRASEILQIDEYVTTKKLNKDEMCKIALEHSRQALEFIQNPSVEVFTYALEMYPSLIDTLHNLPSEIADKLIPTDLELISKFTLTTEQMESLYARFGPVAVYYMKSPPETVQLDMIARDPNLIWYIMNPTKKVIDMVQTAGTPSIYTPAQHFKAKKFGFNAAFAKYETSKFKYNDFCELVIKHKAAVYGPMILSQITGNQELNTGIWVAVNESAADAFFAGLTDYSYVKEVIQTTYGINKKKYYQSGRTSNPSITVTVIRDIIDPINFIMTATHMDMYRIVSDGVGLYTWVMIDGSVELDKTKLTSHHINILKSIQTSWMPDADLSHLIKFVNKRYEIVKEHVEIEKKKGFNAMNFDELTMLKDKILTEINAKLMYIAYTTGTKVAPTKCPILHYIDRAPPS